jgi:hypothetical protein
VLPLLRAGLPVLRRTGSPLVMPTAQRETVHALRAGILALAKNPVLSGVEGGNGPQAQVVWQRRKRLLYRKNPREGGRGQPGPRLFSSVFCFSLSVPCGRAVPYRKSRVGSPSYLLPIRRLNRHSSRYPKRRITPHITDRRSPPHTRLSKLID